jgi:hypothetical protein
MGSRWILVQHACRPSGSFRVNRGEPHLRVAGAWAPPGSRQPMRPVGRCLDPCDGGHWPLRPPPRGVPGHHHQDMYTEKHEDEKINYSRPDEVSSVELPSCKVFQHFQQISLHILIKIRITGVVTLYQGHSSKQLTTLIPSSSVLGYCQRLQCPKLCRKFRETWCP